MNPLYITIAVLSVIAIFFIVALVKSFSSAHWLHLVLIFLTFATTIAGAIVLSRSYKIRSAWQQKFNSNEAQYEKLKREYEVKRDGEPTSALSDIKSARGAASELAKETFGQGRLWSNGAVEVQGDNIVVTLPTTKAEDNRGFVNDQPAIQLQPRMLVYVFRDGPIADSAYNDPTQSDAEPLKPPSPQAAGATTYLGIMQVVSAAGDKVTLKSSSTLNMQERKLKLDAQGRPVMENGKPVIESTPIFPDIAQEFVAPSSTWTLFEKVPVDARDGFKRLRSQILSVDPLSNTTDFNKYQADYRAELKQFMPPENYGLDSADPADAAKHEAIIDRYAFDQMRLTDINKWIDEHKAERLNQSFDPSLDERFVMLKFTEKSNEYEVDSSTSNVRDTGPFDSQGRAVLNILWSTQDGNGKIQLEKDTVVVVDTIAANGDGTEEKKGLKATDKVEDLGEVYVRRLDDYPALISNYNLERERLFDVLLRLVDEIDNLKITEGDTQAQERQRAKLNGQLTQDIANLEVDAKAIEDLRERLNGEIVTSKEQINRLHKVINARYEAIKQRSLEMLNTSR